MSKKFYAVNRKTGNRWSPSGAYTAHYLVLYDSGYLAEVCEMAYGGTTIRPLGPEWALVLQGELRSQHEQVAAKHPTEAGLRVKCARCSGSGKVPDFYGGVLEDSSCCAYDTACPRCNGSGLVPSTADKKTSCSL